jgi:riboflavin kinase/FMN adenylyltransferase
MIAVVGSFDGFHLGHRKLFEAAENLSRVMSDSWCVVTFFPHPQLVLGNKTFLPLFTEPEKDILGKCLGIPEIVRLDFSKDLAGMEPDDFLGFLEDRLFIRGLVVGDDFRFGRGRRGGAELLKELASRRGWEVEIVPHLAAPSGRKIGSSYIRESVIKGDLPQVSEDLGHPFMIRGLIVRGDGRGRTIGFPTINLSLPGMKVLPARGVYAGGVAFGKDALPAAVNIGLNPTFPGGEGIRCEAYIPGFRGELYGREVSLFLFRRLRREKAFPAVSLLVEQMKIDVKDTLAQWQGTCEGTKRFMACCGL